jgi:hypothetical protein
MRSALLATTLKALFKIRRTVVIVGPPGGGKTSIVHQVAHDLGVPIIEKVMPTMLVEDFGIPMPNPETGELTYMVPEWFPVEGKAAPEGILLFDDRNQANTDLQKVMANICQARTLHGHRLPDGWQVVSTGNRQSDRAGAVKILSHLANRETELEYETVVEDWSVWAIENGVPGIAIAFFNFRPSLLNAFDAAKDRNATPRSWTEGVFKVMGNVPPESEFECFKGAVGEGPAAEFSAFLKVYRSLPDPDLVLTNPKTVKVPDDPSTLYALCGALSERVQRSSMSNFVEFINRMPTEFGLLAIKMAILRDRMLATHPAYGQWATVHGHNLI